MSQMVCLDTCVMAHPLPRELRTSLRRQSEEDQQSVGCWQVISQSAADECQKVCVTYGRRLLLSHLVITSVRKELLKELSRGERCAGQQQQQRCAERERHDRTAHDE